MEATTVVLDGSHVAEGEVGGKAFSLNRLLAVGARVPPTGSITTAGYRKFIAESGLGAFLDELRSSEPPAQAELDIETERVDAAFLEAPMPASLADDIRRLADAVRTGGLLAVRSSATAEDMAGASFAGQYRSFLEIDDDEALLRSVRLVWSSLWLPAPRAYRVHTGIPEDDLGMSVVVMRMVDAVRAGVVFTVDPSSAGSNLRVEAVDGLAEDLVSGLVTPEAYVLPRIAAHRPPVDPLLAEVIEEALAIEKAFGGPQDVEWAYNGDQLFLVQARPITTLGSHAEHDPFDTVIRSTDTYTTAGISEALPGVLAPLVWTTAAPLVEQGFRRLFDEMKALPTSADDTPFLARINGRAVLSLDLMKDAAAEVPGGSSEEIERQYFGRVITESTEPPPEQKGPFKGVRSVIAGFREITARRRFRFEAHASIGTIEHLLIAPPDCAIATDSQLLAYRHRALDLAGRVMAAEIAVAASAAAAYRGVELFLEPHVGDEAARLAQQLTAGGIDACGAQIALHTCDLAKIALADAELSAALEGVAARDKRVRKALARTSSGAELISAVELELGQSGSASVFAGETWAESADMAWQLIGQAVQVEQRGRTEMLSPDTRQEKLLEIEAKFTSSWKWRMQRVMTGQIVDIRRRMLHRLVDDAVEFLHLREKTKSAVLALGGEVRRIHLAIGIRLVDNGTIEEPADVDLFAGYELEGALAGAGPSRWELDKRARALQALADAEHLPQIFTGDPSRALVDDVELTGDIFEGWAASGGVYEGTARIITKATEPIEPGDILVARTTDPAWTPLFLTAGAIVVEEGGPLSHAAIIARELGLPAVLNVPGLIKRLGDGPLRLAVDGDRGIVRIVEEASAADSSELAAEQVAS
jgi:pyruvate,water dikinase